MTSAQQGEAVAPRVMTLRDLTAHRFPPRPYLVDPWLRQGESAMLWAAPGVGKTMVALTLALTVAGGGEVMGWRSDAPRRVLLVDGEMHGEDLAARLSSLSATISGMDHEAAGDNLRIMSRHMHGSADGFPDISAREGQRAIMAAVQQHRAAFVILDNLSVLAGGIPDENDAAAMAPVLDFLLQMKARDVAVLLVHHAAKAGTTYRGSSRLATTFEAIIGLHRVTDAGPQDGAGFTLEWTKYRGRPHPSMGPAVMRLSDDPLGGQRWNRRAGGDTRLAELVSAVRTGRYRTQRDLAAAMSIPPHEVTRRKQRAIAAGMITADEWAGHLADPADDEADF